MKSRLRILRAERNWTQADLAQRLEVSRQTVNAVETEKYEPSLSLAFKIARLFGMPIEDIFQNDQLDSTDIARKASTAGEARNVKYDYPTVSPSESRSKS